METGRFRPRRATPSGYSLLISSLGSSEGILVVSPGSIAYGTNSATLAKYVEYSGAGSGRRRESGGGLWLCADRDLQSGFIRGALLHVELSDRNTTLLVCRSVKVTVPVGRSMGEWAGRAGRDGDQVFGDVTVVRSAMAAIALETFEDRDLLN